MKKKDTLTKLKQNINDIDLRNNALVKWLENYLTPSVCTLLNPYLGVLTYSIILLAKDSFDHKLEKEQKKLLEKFLTELSVDFDVNRLDEAKELPFIKDYAKTLEVVLRQRNSEKIIFFANLLKYGYSSENGIPNSDFDIYFSFINDLSYMELYILYAISTVDEVRLGEPSSFSQQVEENLKIPTERIKLLLNKLLSTSLVSRLPTYGNMAKEIPEDYAKTELLDDFIQYISEKGGDSVE